MSIDLIGYVAATLTTLSFAPQALHTLRTRDTASLSLTMYAMFTTGVCVWLVYGVLRHDLALIGANTVTVLLAISILWVKVRNVLSGQDRVVAARVQ